MQRPVLLKRGLSATITELLMAAEYIMAHGNTQIVLCERGIRTFETMTRNTLDISAIPVIKRESHLPVIVDPSHAGGDAGLVASTFARGYRSRRRRSHRRSAPRSRDGAFRRGSVASHSRIREPHGKARSYRGSNAATARGVARMTPDLKDELKRRRDEIAKLDGDLIALLKRRVDLAIRTGELKREIGLPILDPGREATVIREAGEKARSIGLAEEPVREIFWRILALSRGAQQEQGS